MLYTPAMAEDFCVPLVIQEGETDSIVSREISNIVTEWNNDNVEAPTKSYQNIDTVGGLIQNSGIITSIENSKFTSNKVNYDVTNETEYKGIIYNFYGGLIYNDGEITSIKNTEFKDNNLSYDVSGGLNTRINLYGGLLHNNGYIKEISNVKFDNNTISISNDSGFPIMYGGILSNTGEIETLNADMTNNTILYDKPIGNAHNYRAGLLYNNGKIETLSGTYSDNSIINNAPDRETQNTHGLIYNDNNGTITKADLTFLNNNISLENYQTIETNLYTEITGGLLDCAGIIDELKLTLNNNKTRSFSNNYATANIGLVRITGQVRDTYISAKNNLLLTEAGKGYSYARSGVLDIHGVADSVSGIFESNSTIAKQIVFDNESHDVHGLGGCILIQGSVDVLSGLFRNNSLMSISKNTDLSAGEGGAIAIRGTLNKIENSLFEQNLLYVESDSNKTQALGGAIAVFNGGVVKEIRNSRFINNTAEVKSTSDDIALHGGAIYSSTDLNIVSDAGETEFTGNKTILNGKVDDNAIYLDNTEGTITFNQINNGKTILNDNIRGASVKVAETDDEGNIVLDDEGNQVTTTKHYSVNITGDDTGMFGLYNDIYDANVSIGNTTLNTVNNLVHNYEFNSLTLTGNTNMVADVDLANAVMDRFSAKDYGEHSGNLTLTGFNLLSEVKKDTTDIFFAEKGLKDNVSTTVSEIYTPIYKYKVAYDNREDGGYFVFNRGAAASGNPSENFNPALLSSAVSSVAAAQATVNETFKYAFENADTFTQMPSMDRKAMLYANKYALSTDFDENRGSLTYKNNNKGGWFRPYASFESMSLKNGPKVDAITYGSIVGFDSDFYEHKNGWCSVGTGYIGYNGSQLDYAGVDTTMNGGLLGYTHTMYKDNFWTALSLTTGASVGETSTMYGKEDFTSLMAGIGSKTGYNFEFKEGKYILQPILFLSYTFVNTFDYTNAAGVRINSDPAHSIQINPSVKFIANTKNGWQPYVNVGMVWNVMNENKVMANNAKLPEMGMKPYVEYGVGLQKTLKDRFIAFGQAMIRNGGRNGIALTAGFRWAIGKDGDSQKVEKAVPVRVSSDLTRGMKTLEKSVPVKLSGNSANEMKKATTKYPTLSAREIVTGAAAPTVTRTVVKQLKR